MRRLGAADPAREAVPASEATERLLARILSDIRQERDERDAFPARRRRRGLVVVLAVALSLALAAGALAAVGVIRLGAAAPSSRLLENPRQGIGALLPGTARLLGVATADPAGGLPWGMRALSTSRGVGCIEVGRLLDHRLGVLGQDGAFGDDARFHELPVGALDNGGQCANLDANGRLFLNVSVGRIPRSGWSGRGSCVSQVPT